MPWTKLQFAPGIVKDTTRYANAGGWYDGNFVRFRQGLPEMWKGWIKMDSSFEFMGICRSLHRHDDLSSFTWLSSGTSDRFYMSSDSVNYDVTPYSRVQALGANPLATTNASSLITVTDTAHGQTVGNYVVLTGATSVGGILNTQINSIEFAIVTVVNDNSYTIDTGVTASSTTSGGGAGITASYIYDAGSADQVYGGGWGTLTWGEEEWGGDSALAIGERMGIWSQDNWGEDLVANPQGGPIFYWDASSPTARMVDILDLVGADGNAPTSCEFILVSHRDRHLLAFGATEFGTGNGSPLLVRWCDQEDITSWNEADTAGTAGSMPLSSGSKLISAIQAQSEIIVWSDTAIFSMSYIGAPYIYSSELIENRSDIVGLKACTAFGSTVYWFGRSGIYMYTGRVTRIDCPIWDYIFNRINWEQATKIVACTNRQYNEVMFFYPSTDGVEIDSMFSLNVEDNTWSTAALPRTAWLDMDAFNNPVGASPDGYHYVHESGASDGSTAPESAIDAYIESSPFELSSEGAFDRGDRFMFIRRILPDVTFRNYGTSTPSMNIVLKMMDKPGGGFEDTSSSQVSRSVTLPVEEFTDDLHVRIRGRALVLRAESSIIDTQWRLGVPRIDVRPDGQR